MYYQILSDIYTLLADPNKKHWTDNANVIIMLFNWTTPKYKVFLPWPVFILCWLSSGGGEGWTSLPGVSTLSKWGIFAYSRIKVFQWAGTIKLCLHLGSVYYMQYINTAIYRWNVIKTFNPKHPKWYGPSLDLEHTCTMQVCPVMKGLNLLKHILRPVQVI